MVEARINNVAKLVDAAVAATEKFGGSSPWSRGQSVSTWKLRPSVFRMDDAGYRYEQNIANYFMIRARSRHPNCPDNDDAPNWLFLMQHYGLPTRLLDWTESILIATYFAVRDEKLHDEDGAVWALSGTDLNEDQTSNHTFISPRHPAASIIFREALGVHSGKSSNCIIATHSSQTDIRMMVQLSEFTLHGVPTPIEELPNKEKFLMQFIIPRTAKSGLKQLFGLFGISESTLFPDLEHLAADLREKSFNP